MPSRPPSDCGEGAVRATGRQGNQAAHLKTLHLLFCPTDAYFVASFTLVEPCGLLRSGRAIGLPGHGFGERGILRNRWVPCSTTSAARATRSAWVSGSTTCRTPPGPKHSRRGCRSLHLRPTTNWILNEGCAGNRVHGPDRQP